MGVSGLLNACLSLKECSHSSLSILAKLDMVDGQLHETDGSCATSDSKVMTRAVNKLKMRSKTDEVASVGLKITKLARRASGIGLFASS